MKKALIPMLILAAALSLAACGTLPAATGETGCVTAGEVYREFNIGSAFACSSEMEKYPELEKLIAQEWSIPEDELGGTRYYYNRIDLNGDDVEEILALVVGNYTSGSGGNSMLVVKQDGDKLSPLFGFTLISPPVIVSDTVTDGWKDLIVPTGDSWTRLYWDGKFYKSVNDGEPMSSINGVTGTAVFYNDLAADIDSPDALRLG